MGEHRNTLRIEQSKEELGVLRQGFDQWHRLRLSADTLRRHSAQLDALALVIESALDVIAADLETIDSTMSEGHAYERCRTADGRSLFVRRLWDSFRQKWDDREEDHLASTFAAADEVIWSCWATPFRLAGVTPPPAPLPYLEPEYAPTAVLRSAPPLELRLADELLRDTLAALPIPLIGMPPLCVQRPWWLVLMAHETAHHLEAELDPGMTSKVRQTIADAATAAGLAPKRWEQWSGELFADAFGLGCVGEAHLWAIEELELSSDDAMERDDLIAYPPPRVREAFGRASLAALEGRQDNVNFGTIAGALVSTPLLSKAELSLARLTDWRADRFSKDGAVASLARELGASRPPAITSGPELPRLVVAAAIRAADRVGEIADEQARAAERRRLRDRLVEMLTRCGEPGMRGETWAPVKTSVRRLADHVASALAVLPASEVS
jgi:hypothetical protein